MLPVDPKIAMRFMGYMYVTRGKASSHQGDSHLISGVRRLKIENRMTPSTGTVKITDFLDVSRKLSELGGNPPGKLALLPINFETATSIDELLQASETLTIGKLLREQGLPLDNLVDRSRRPPYIKNKSHEWVAPILFVAVSWYSQNPALVSVALDVVGNYATAFFGGLRGNREVTLNIVVQKKSGLCRKISYHGPAEGLKDLARVVREAGDE